MIISASRRTDIPAFYSEWFMRRIRAGFCTVPNPIRKNQVSHVSLRPEDVDVIVFWTRNPAPLIKHLGELDERGYRYYFQYTIMDNPLALDPSCPTTEKSLKTARALADRIGMEKIIWRYDPIVFASQLDAGFHKKTYERIACAMRGHTQCSVISIVDITGRSKSGWLRWPKKDLRFPGRMRQSPFDKLRAGRSSALQTVIQPVGGKVILQNLWCRRPACTRWQASSLHHNIRIAATRQLKLHIQMTPRSPT